MAAKSQKVDTPSKVEWVRVGDCHVGAKYQRIVNTKLVDKIAREFDPFLLAIPSVVRRDDGSLWVTDGQHRILALRKMGYDDQLIQCEVQEEVSYEKSALTHVDRNDLRRGTSPIDKFRGRVEAKQPMQLDIKRIVESFGMEVGSRSEKSSNDRPQGIVSAISTLEQLYTNGGGDHLKAVLRIITETWGTESDAVQAPILKAISRLLAEYDRLLDEARLVRSLKRYRPMEYVKRAYAGKELNRSNVPANIVVAIVADYNNLPGGRKLPPATDLVGQGHRGRGSRRLTVAQRAQVVELLSNGYSNAEVKERYPGATTKLLQTLRRELKPMKRKQKKVAAKAS